MLREFFGRITFWKTSKWTEGPTPTKIKIGSREILLPNPVMQTLIKDGVHLILMKPFSLPVAQLRRTLLAYDSDGNFLWEVQPAPYSGTNQPHFWSNIYIENGVVRIGCSDTDLEDYILEFKTGEVFHESGPQVPVIPDRPPRRVGRDFP